MLTRLGREVGVRGTCACFVLEPPRNACFYVLNRPNQHPRIVATCGQLYPIVTGVLIPSSVLTIRSCASSVRVRPPPPAPTASTSYSDSPRLHQPRIRRLSWNCAGSHLEHGATRRAFSEICLGDNGLPPA